MSEATAWHRKFYESTRGRVLSLLRRESRTVDELARELGLTDNAIRAHLVALERDGLVQQRGVRRGVGKPATVYALSGEAERLFPKAHGTVLRQLLDVLVERMDGADVEGVLREVGRRLASARPSRGRDAASRLRDAVDAIAELGGQAELVEGDEGPAIRGLGCPLAGTVVDHPQVCLLAESLLEELAGVPVRERCERGEQPRCYFEVGVRDGRGSRDRPARRAGGRAR